MKQIQVKRFFSGLSGELLLWFLLIALMPLCITSWVNYQDAKDHILADTTEHLIDISLLQTTDIHEEFDERMVGAVVASAHGRGVVLAKVVIDATGNSDIAAAACSVNKSANRFLSFLDSPKAIRIFKSHGFSKPSD